MNERIKKTASYIKDIDALLIEDPINIFYLTGLDVSLGSLVITKRKATIYLDGRYYESARAKKIVDVQPRDALIDALKGKKVGFDQEKTAFCRYQELKKHKIALHPVPNIVKNHVRLIKSPEEIALMKKAAKLAAKGYYHAVNALKTGISEEEVARILKLFWLENGSNSISFEPIVAFGKHSACPHHRPTSKKLKKGDIVLFDLGTNYEHYASDMTRVLFFGKPDPRLVKIYQIVLEAQERALKKCQPGAKISALDKTARGYIAKQGYGKEFSHSLGHGVGLEIHEEPTMKGNSGSLEAGMVITIEPGVYVPSLGGIRIEDTVIITKGGCESITPISRDLIILD